MSGLRPAPTVALLACALCASALTACGTNLAGEWKGTCALIKADWPDNATVDAKLQEGAGGGKVAGGAADWRLYPATAAVVMGSSSCTYTGSVGQCDNGDGCTITCTGVQKCTAPGKHDSGWILGAFTRDGSGDLMYLEGTVGGGVWSGTCELIDGGVNKNSTIDLAQ